VLIVANVPIEIVRHPEGTKTVEYPVGFLSHERFPRMQNGRKRSVGCFDECMNMIGHDAPSNHPVALSVEMQQSLLHEMRNTLVTQVTDAVSGILVVLDDFAERDGFGAVCIETGVPVEFALPALDTLVRHRIGQPE